MEHDENDNVDPEETQPLIATDSLERSVSEIPPPPELGETGEQDIEGETQHPEPCHVVRRKQQVVRTHWVVAELDWHRVRGCCHIAVIAPCTIICIGSAYSFITDLFWSHAKE